MHLIEVLRNLGDAASNGSGPGGVNDWLPGLFGGTAGSWGNMMREAIKKKAEQQQQEQNQQKSNSQRASGLL